ncbi:hypothetical protein AALP_AA3G134700 [Arabis alpina]|uniref:Secreted protein n=1 Tax=Arabis alpina TaxID=50452 RepID=A0A087H8Z8_ARAAL|nr:hypothetical protein AALP_AA3G134700 [Arabis alpina]
MVLPLCYFWFLSLQAFAWKHHRVSVFVFGGLGSSLGRFRSWTVAQPEESPSCLHLEGRVLSLGLDASRFSVLCRCLLTRLLPAEATISSRLPFGFG